MAMIRCTECRKDISDKAATCPHCGAPVNVVAALAERENSRTRTLKWIGAAILVYILLRACSSAGSNDPVATIPDPSAQPVATVQQAVSQESLKYWMTDLVDEKAPAARRESYANNIINAFPNTPEAAKAKELLPTLTARAAEERSYGAWSYRNEEEGMSGKRTGSAIVASDNTLSLGFPYEGPQHGTLAVRRHPSWGNDVILSIQEGQILCSSYECPIRIRFDDSPPVTYSGNEPADNSTNTVFLPYSIAKKLQTAKRVKIEMNVYQNGIQVLDFNVKGFDPDKMNQQAKS